MSALVETVAHTESAMKFYKNPHVIVDVGGQDIKLIVLKDGRVKDFKLNTQCSAGNGYFLQGTAESLGYKVEEYADIAFSASTMPIFGYGCAVFMQSDIVNFQRQGWRGEEILAGLANVLPKNIFLYVAGIPNLAKLGSRFILQGGTQKNLAAVKSEVDFIHSHFHGAGHEPEVIVHEHCGESGAIGAGVEAIRLYKNGHRTNVYRPRCSPEDRLQDHAQRRHALLLLQEQLPAHLHRRQRRRRGANAGARVAAACLQVEGAAAGRRAAPDHLDLRKRPGRGRRRHARHQGRTRRDQEAESELRRHRRQRSLALAQSAEGCRSASHARPLGFRKAGASNSASTLMNKRKTLRVGMPRVLNMYLYAPLFSGYLESLGLEPENLVYSEFTGQEMYRQGAGRGAIDPCFPSKIGIPHVYNLIFQKHAEEAARRHLLPHDRHHESAAEELQRRQRLPDGDGDAECSEGGVHQGRRRLQGQRHSVSRSHPEHRRPEAAGPCRCSRRGHRFSACRRKRTSVRIEAGFKAFEDFDRSMRKRVPRGAGHAGAREPAGHRDAGPRLSSRSRLESRDHGRVPEARLPGVLAELPAQWTKTCSTASSARRCARARSPTHSTFATCGRTLTPAAPTSRSGRRSSPLGIPIWWHWRSATSSAVTTRPIYSVIEDIIENSGTPYFCVQGPRREQADGLHQDSRRDHRLLPEALPRRLAEEGRDGEGAGSVSSPNTSAHCACQLTHKSLRRDDVVIPFPQAVTEPEAATASGDD